ncbi:hypothetical protein EDD11_003333, partial [Mortierella claussenii]
MSIFKRSSKNKTSSAASTPTQTPRASIQDSRPQIRSSTNKMMQLTPDEAMHMILEKNMSSGVL